MQTKLKKVKGFWTINQNPKRQPPPPAHPHFQSLKRLTSHSPPQNGWQTNPYDVHYMGRTEGLLPFRYESMYHAQEHEEVSLGCAQRKSANHRGVYWVVSPLGLLLHRYHRVLWGLSVAVAEENDKAASYRTEKIIFLNTYGPVCLRVFVAYLILPIGIN